MKTWEIRAWCSGLCTVAVVVAILLGMTPPGACALALVAYVLGCIAGTTVKGGR